MHLSYILAQEYREDIMNVLHGTYNKIQWFGTNLMTIMLQNNKSIQSKIFISGNFIFILEKYKLHIYCFFQVVIKTKKYLILHERIYLIKKYSSDNLYKNF